MNKIHNFIGEQIIKYIFRHGGMITVQRKAGAVQVAKVYSKAAYENVIVPAFNLYTHQNIKTQADRIRSMSDEELADFLADSEIFSPCKNCDFHFVDAMNDDCKAPDGWICTKGYAAALIQKWLQSEVEE